jgi:hypothetical protein
LEGHQARDAEQQHRARVSTHYFDLQGAERKTMIIGVLTTTGTQNQNPGELHVY